MSRRWRPLLARGSSPPVAAADGRNEPRGFSPSRRRRGRASSAAKRHALRPLWRGKRGLRLAVARGRPIRFTCSMHRRCDQSYWAQLPRWTKRSPPTGKARHRQRVDPGEIDHVFPIGGMACLPAVWTMCVGATARTSALPDASVIGGMKLHTIGKGAGRLRAVATSAMSGRRRPPPQHGGRSVAGRVSSSLIGPAPAAGNEVTIRNDRRHRQPAMPIAGSSSEGPKRPAARRRRPSDGGPRCPARG